MLAVCDPASSEEELRTLALQVAQGVCGRGDGEVGIRGVAELVAHTLHAPRGVARCVLRGVADLRLKLA